MSVTLAQAEEEKNDAQLALKKHNASKPSTFRTAGALSWRKHFLNRTRGQGKGSRTNIKDTSMSREWRNEHKRLRKELDKKKKAILEIKKSQGQEHDKEPEHLVQKEAKRQHIQEQKQEQDQEQDQDQDQDQELEQEWQEEEVEGGHRRRRQLVEAESPPSAPIEPCAPHTNGQGGHGTWEDLPAWRSTALPVNGLVRTRSHHITSSTTSY